ncbi:ABC transporter G family member 21 [Linum grandiflorum]
MMPPQQEMTTITPANTGPTANRSVPFLVHAEPASNSSINDDQGSSHNLPKFVLLHQILPPITLKFEEVGYSVNLTGSRGIIATACLPSTKPKSTRPILNGVTGMVQPGELLAMLGPSGSGKTTLLTALAGRLPGKITGTITYNSSPFSTSIKRRIGFVTQDDVLYPHLTVIETLTYAALLRLPKTLSREEKSGQAEAVLEELGLDRCRETIVGGGSGGSTIRGVSGGERKRVSIGQEMLVNPSLLLLDEPTSGLDSTTAQRIMSILRAMARGGRTVVTTIHQPSSRLYTMFDKVVVLSDGYPIYSGRADRVMEYFGSVGCGPNMSFVNPADFLLDLANGIIPDANLDDPSDFHSKLDHQEDHNSVKQQLVSSYKKNLHPALKLEMGSINSQDSAVFAPSSQTSSNGCKWTATWWQQFKVLFGRGLRERKHESYSGLKIFQVMSVALLSGLLWWHSDTSHIQDQVGLLFFFSIFWGFFPMFNAIFTFPQEQPMLIKERSSGMYRLSSYYFARIAGDLPMELVLPTIFVTVAYWMGGLKPSLPAFVLTLSVILLSVLVSQGLGLAIGAILMEVKQATVLSSVTMLVFLLAGGYYIQHIPPFISWIKYVSFSHYCYKLLVRVQYSANEVYECEPGRRCRVMDFEAIRCLGLENVWWDVAALVVMLVGYRALAYIALRIRLPH